MSKRIKTKISPEDEKVVAQYVYKYLDFNNLKAVKELKKIDLFRNNYLDKTISSYIIGMRSYLMKGHLNKGVPVFIKREAEELSRKHYPRLTPSFRDKYIPRNFKSMPTEEVKVEEQGNIFSQPTDTTSQKISAIKSKLALDLKGVDSKIKEQQRILNELILSKDSMKAKILDKIFELFE